MQHQNNFELYCRQMNLRSEKDWQAKILSYATLLQKWNKAYNLIGDSTEQEILKRHILDSLSIVPFLNENNILDVGTGAGLPGIPLAIYFPAKNFTLVDSNGKKTRFLQQVVHELKLPNVIVLNARIEQLDRDKTYDLILSRAFAAVKLMLDLTQPLLTANGKFLAMKGKLPTEELAGLAEVFTIKIEKLFVPGVDAERHLLIIGEK